MFVKREQRCILQLATLTEHSVLPTEHVPSQYVAWKWRKLKEKKSSVISFFLSFFFLFRSWSIKAIKIIHMGFSQTVSWLEIWQYVSKPLTLAHILYLTLSVLVTSIVESLMQTLTWGGKLKAFSCLWTSFSDLTGSLNLTPLRSLLHQKKVSCGGSFCILKWTKIIILWV